MAAVALALTGPALADAPHHESAARCGGHVVRVGQARSLTAKVWNPARWRRGAPKHAAIAAHRRQVRCAAGPGHRAAIRHRWAVARDRYRHHRRHELYCRSGVVVRGRVSYFGGGLTASGLIADSTPGLALNIAPGTDSGWNNATTRSWVEHRQPFRVTIASHTATLPVIDLGPAGFTQRAIDVTTPGVGVLGLSGAFPTDAIGTAKLIPTGCP